MGFHTPSINNNGLPFHPSSSQRVSRASSTGKERTGKSKTVQVLNQNFVGQPLSFCTNIHKLECKQVEIQLKVALHLYVCLCL